MTPDREIPAALVEAVARGVYDYINQEGRSDTDPLWPGWDREDDAVRIVFTEEARQNLSAALAARTPSGAPYLMLVEEGGEG